MALTVAYFRQQRCRNLPTLRLFRTIDENGNEARTMLPNTVAIVAIAVEKQASVGSGANLKSWPCSANGQR